MRGFDYGPRELIMSSNETVQMKFTGEPGSIRDRRSHQRIELTLNGRFMTPNQEDHGLITENVSCAGALVESPHKPDIGQRVICYIDGLGRIDAYVSRITEVGFAVAFRTTKFKRDKLADKIIWLANKDELGLSEERGAKRFVARSGPVLLTRENGRQIQCRVIDISLTGAGLETDGPVPMVGEIVSSSNFRGEVVRCKDKGFGIRFLTAFKQEADLPGRIDY